MNSWLVMFIWGVYLNGYGIIALLLGLIGTGLLLFVKGEVNYRRIIAVSIISYMVLIGVLFHSNIPYFFPDLHIFMSVIVLDAAVTNEYLYRVRKKIILQMLSLILAAYAMLSILIVILPDASYTIFSKNSLFLMESFIFLPYLLPLAYALAYRNFRSLIRKNRLEKKGATL